MTPRGADGFWRDVIGPRRQPWPRGRKPTGRRSSDAAEIYGHRVKADRARRWQASGRITGRPAIPAYPTNAARHRSTERQTSPTGAYRVCAFGAAAVTAEPSRRRGCGAQDRVDLGDDGRSLADGGGHPLGRAGADIADCEHARQARLQRERRLRARPDASPVRM